MVSDLVTLTELSKDVKNNFDSWVGLIAGALEPNDYLDKI
jgi:hypothetical protein